MVENKYFDLAVDGDAATFTEKAVDGLVERAAKLLELRKLAIAKNYFAQEE